MTIYKHDFTTYCRDLNKITGGFSEADFISNQSKLSFSEILDHAILSDLKILPLLQSVDCCLIAHDTFECNPQYSHVGTYLINRYNLSCDVFDVIGDGFMPAVQVAEHLIDRYRVSKKIESAVILIFCD